MKTFKIVISNFIDLPGAFKLKIFNQLGLSEMYQCALWNSKIFDATFKTSQSDLDVLENDLKSIKINYIIYEGQAPPLF